MMFKEYLNKKLTIIKSNINDFIPYLILFSLDFIIALFFFTNLKILNGYLVLGDLPAFYNFGPPNILYITNLTIYPLIEQLFSYLIGSGLSQNIIFITSLFLPSFSILSFLREFEKDSSITIAISIILGTPLNPILYVFSMGGYEWPIWLFFLFLSFKFIVKDIKKNTLTFKNILISSIFYSFSITSTILSIIYIYLSALYLITIFIFIIINIKIKNKYKLLYLSIFLISTLLITFSSNYSFLLYSIKLYENEQIIRDYVLGNIKYTFQNDNVYNSIFISIWSGIYGFLTSIYWYIIIFFAFLGGIISLFKKDFINKLSMYFFIVYLIISLIIILFHYNIITPYFLYIKIFDHLDSDTFYKLIQLIAIPLLLLNFITFLKNIDIEIKYENKPIKFKLKNKNIKNIVISIILVALVFFNIFSINYTPQHMVNNLNNNIYPNYFEDINKWYSHENVTGKILFLPYNYNTLSVMYGFLKKNDIWNPPVGVITPFFNYTMIIDMLKLFEFNTPNILAQQLALSNIQYILLINQSNQFVTVIPNESPYYLNSPLLVSKIHILNLLNNGSFSIVYKNNNFIIWKNEYYNKYYKHLLLYNNLFIKNKFSYNNILNSSKYGSYLSTNVKNYNNIIKLNIIGNSSTPYTLISYFLYINNGIISYNYTNTNELINISKFINYEYRLSAKFYMGLYSNLSIYILFYNTSSPKGFYDEFLNYPLGNYNSSGSINVTISIPKNAKSMNIVFHGWSYKKATTYVNLSNISLIQITPLVSYDPSIEENILNQLKNIYIINDSLILGYPYFNSKNLKIENNTLVGFMVAMNYLYLNPKLNNNISLNIKNYINYNGNVSFYLIGYLEKGKGYIKLSIENVSEINYFENQTYILFKTKNFNINNSSNININTSNNIKILILGVIKNLNYTPNNNIVVLYLNTSLGNTTIVTLDHGYKIIYPNNFFYQTEQIGPLNFISDISLILILIIVFKPKFFKLKGRKYDK